MGNINFPDKIKKIGSNDKYGSVRGENSEKKRKLSNEGLKNYHDKKDPIDSQKIMNELSITPKKGSKEAVEMVVKMGRPLDKNSLSQLIDSLPPLIGKYGEENTKSIILLKLLNIGISRSTIDLGNFILSSVGKNISSELFRTLNNISDLLSTMFERFSLKFDGAKNSPFLNLNSKLSSLDIVNFLKFIGYGRNKMESLSHLLRIISILSTNKKLDTDGKNGEILSNMVDSQKLLSNSTDYNFHFTLPFVLDDEYGEANFSYKKEKKNNYNLNFYMELSKLGAMRISLYMSKDSISISFYMDNKSGMDKLRENFSELKSSLLEKEISISSINFYHAKREKLVIKPIPLEYSDEKVSHFNTFG